MRTILRSDLRQRTMNVRIRLISPSLSITKCRSSPEFSTRKIDVLKCLSLCLRVSLNFYVSLLSNPSTSFSPRLDRDLGCSWLKFRFQEGRWSIRRKLYSEFFLFENVTTKWPLSSYNPQKNINLKDSFRETKLTKIPYKDCKWLRKRTGVSSIHTIYLKYKRNSNVIKHHLIPVTNQ